MSGETSRKSCQIKGVLHAHVLTFAPGKFGPLESAHFVPSLFDMLVRQQDNIFKHSKDILGHVGGMV